jgi:hypothetical protein
MATPTQEELNLLIEAAKVEKERLDSTKERLKIRQDEADLARASNALNREQYKLATQAIDARKDELATSKEQWETEQKILEAHRSIIAASKIKYDSGTRLVAQSEAQLQLLQLELEELIKQGDASEEDLEKAKKKIKDLTKTLGIQKKLSKELEIQDPLAQGLVEKGHLWNQARKDGLMGELALAKGINKTNQKLDKGLSIFFAKMKEMVMGLDKAENQFERTTGLGKEFSLQVRSTYKDLRGLGVSAEQAAESHQNLAKSFTDFTMMAPGARQELADTGAVLGKLGVAAGDYAKGIQTMTKMLGQTAMEAEETSRELVAFAKDIGVAPGDLSAKFAAMGPQLAKFGREGTKAFKDMAAISKITGMEMEKVLAIANKFDTFEDAAGMAGKLNAALGGNFVNAMDMMMETDPAARFGMVRDAIKDAGLSFDDMSYYQKQFYTESLGLSDVGDLAMALSGNMNDLSGDMGKTSKDLVAMKKQARGVQDIMDKWNSVLAQSAPLLMGIADALSNGLTWLQEHKEAMKMIIPIMVTMRGVTFALSIAQALATITGKKQTVMFLAMAAAVAALGFLLYQQTWSSNFVEATIGLAAAFAIVAVSVKYAGKQLRRNKGAMLAVGLAMLFMGIGVGIATKGFTDFVAVLLLANDQTGLIIGSLIAVGVTLIALMVAMAVFAVKTGGIGVAAVLAMGFAFLMLGAGIYLAVEGFEKLIGLVETLTGEIMTKLATVFSTLAVGFALFANPVTLLGMVAFSSSISKIAFSLSLLALAITPIVKPLTMIFGMMTGLAMGGMASVTETFAKVENIVNKIKEMNAMEMAALAVTMGAVSASTVATAAAAPAAAMAGGVGGAVKGMMPGSTKIQVKLDETQTKKFLEGNWAESSGNHAIGSAASRD